MAAPVLTLAEQKKSLASKKKKKVVKNVLGLPKSVKLDSIVITQEENEKIAAILGRLLPAAKLPVQNNRKLSGNNEKTNETPEELEAIKQAKNKRNQIALGVNDLNRSIKKNLISAVLLANDVRPRFLICHLHLLCRHNGIPFIEMPDLRQIIQNCLGFPCIALGFKKESDYFNEAVLNIQAVSQKYTAVLENNNSTLSSSDSETGADDKYLEIESTSAKHNNDKPFEFLYRTSTKERAFIPERLYENGEKSDKETKSNDGFISFGENTCNDVENKANSTISLGISTNFQKNEKKIKKKLNSNKLTTSDTDEEELDVPKKKPKLGWALDKKGTKSKVKFSPTNVIKFQSNENRKKKKNK